MPFKIILVVGTRPNFMKVAPLMKVLSNHLDIITPILVHTGQHYDRELSELFFEQLKMSEPDIFLGVGSGSHAEQTAKIMVELERVLNDEKPDLVIVFGDVNSTLASAVVTAKLCIRLAHVEAGLRSFDNTMPEEINRIVTDRLSDYLFITENSALVNLKKEGISKEKIFFVGNIMIDSLINNLETAQDSNILEQLDLSKHEYVTLTMHRPANVDNHEILAKLISIISKIGEKVPVIFPCHPRTKKRMEQYGLLSNIDNKFLRIIRPLGYIDFLKLQMGSKFIITDSGGIQEETTYLGIPCITIRDNTERPITVDIGSNVITGINAEKIIETADNIIDGKGKTCKVPKMWDGKTSDRILGILLRIIKNDYS